jgi:hypothetical protein
MPWDSGHYDDGFWDSDSAPISIPKPKKKPMKLPRWFPRTRGAQIVMLRNFKNKLPNHTPTPLGLVPAEVTAVLLDVDNALYALETYRGAAATFPDAAYQRIEDALNNEDLAGNIIWLDFAPPNPAPAAVSYGCLQRFFTFVEDKLKKAGAYDTAIGNDLGIEAAAAAAPDATASPEFDIRETTGGKGEIVWPKGPYDGVRIEINRGAAGLLTDIDLRPNYTINWLPATGQAVVIQVRLRFIYKGEDFGNWSPWQNWTLTGE